MAEKKTNSSKKDLFWLETVYPDVKSLFARLPSLEDVKESCYVVLDTNVLLFPFTVTRRSLEEIKSTYERLIEQNRLVIPAQVAREFVNIRGEKIKAVFTKLSDMRSNVQKLTIDTYPLLENLEGYKRLQDLKKGINEQLDGYKEEIGKLQDLIKGWICNDPISLMYARLFKPDLIKEVSIDRENIKSDFLYRRENKIPPGYKDAERIGDLLIWHTILELGEREKRSVIFVSLDEKADWWYRIEKEPIYPRFELIDEYRRKSEGQLFHMMSFSQFLDFFGADKEVIEEVRREEDRLVKLRRPSTGTIQSAEVNVSESATVPIMINDVTGAKGAHILLEFDSSVVNAVAIGGSAFGFETYKEINNTAGYVRYAVANIAGGLTGNIKFADVTLEGRNAGESPLKLEVISLSDGTTEISRDVTDGKFTVTGSTNKENECK